MNSLITCTMANIYVGGQIVAGQCPQHLKLIPAHITADGKKISSKLEFAAYANMRRGTNVKTGEAGRADAFKFTIWGPAAVLGAKTLTVGKMITVSCEPRSYLGRLFRPDGQQIIDSTGQPVMTNKVNFNIDQFELGNDGAKWIEFEIMNGWRPAQWNNPQHPDNAAWKNEIARRMSLTWDGRSPSFGYARIVAPNGQIDLQNMGNGTKASTTVPAYATPTYNQAPAAPPMYTANAGFGAQITPAPVQPQVFNAPVQPGFNPGFGAAAPSLPQFQPANPGTRKLF